jgi:Zn ribbon nucleic-acid-binding protein
MAEQPPAGFRRHRFLEQSIDLPDHLTEAQLDGRACIRCGHEAEPGEAMRPVEAWSEQSAQLFECDDTEACAHRQEAPANA